MGGKSNILDSICFVFGISNLSKIRVSNMQELLYKQGQEGTKKASVTINFDNCNPKSVHSPIGYENFEEINITRQIFIGGKCKYLINGKKVDANVVQSLFHSVQLNINNPHFLIMQGGVTKFLNAKPHEMLSMIEEATSTRLYESKKNLAMKILDKKQMKMKTIDELLKTYILPGLNKLREEQTAYCRWKEINRDIERLKRMIIVLELKNQENFLNYIEKQIKFGKNQITKINLFKKKYNCNDE